MKQLQYWTQAKNMVFRVPPYRTESMAVFLMMPEKWIHKQSSGAKTKQSLDSHKSWRLDKYSSSDNNSRRSKTHSVSKWSEGISKGRAVITEEYFKKLFNELKTLLIEQNALNILNDPTRIFNWDETSFSLCSKTEKVLTPIISVHMCDHLKM